MTHQCKEVSSQKAPRFEFSAISWTICFFLLAELSFCRSWRGLTAWKPGSSPSLTILMLESSSLAPILLTSDPSWSPNCSSRTCELQVQKSYHNFQKVISIRKRNQKNWTSILAASVHLVSLSNDYVLWQISWFLIWSWILKIQEK